MLADIAIFLAAAVLFVPLFRRLGLGAVLGYLAAGIAIGPWGFKLITGVENILHFSEFGVMLLLFIIGLELQPSRLWTLRRAVFGLGGVQVVMSMLALAGAALMFGLPCAAALVAGFGLAMSSTAFALQMLAEKNELASRHGRSSFAILLFQDLSVIPFLALIPLLAAGGVENSGGDSWLGFVKIISVFVLVVLGGRYALRPVFRIIAAAKTPEVFTAAALLIVVATALAMERAGLSMSLGAFMAGVLLADSEYRHELQADIEPFKGLLLGLFFIAVGMSADVGLLRQKLWLVMGLVAGLLLIKGVILYALGLVTKLPRDSARALAFALPQGGEFAFVLFTTATAAGLMSPDLQALLVVVVTLSMIATPPLYALQAHWRAEAEQKPYDQIDAAENQIIIAGFGPFGQVVGRILRLKKMSYTVLEKDSAQVDFVRRFGNKVYYGDAGRLDLLRAAHAGKARYFVLTVADQETSLHIAETVRRNFPRLRVFAVAKTRQHAMRLMDLGINDIIRRSYFSSLEMARGLMLALDESEDNAAKALQMFRGNDEETLRRQHAVAHDEQALIQTARDSARELEQLFEADAGRGKSSGGP